MPRIAALVCIVVGTAIIGFSPNRWDVVVATFRGDTESTSTTSSAAH